MILPEASADSGRCAWRCVRFCQARMPFLSEFACLQEIVLPGQYFKTPLFLETPHVNKPTINKGGSPGSKKIKIGRLRHCD